MDNSRKSVDRKRTSLTESGNKGSYLQRLTNKVKTIKNTSKNLKEYNEKFEQAQKDYDLCIKSIKEYNEKFGKLQFKDQRIKEEEVYAAIRDAKFSLMQARVEFSLMQAGADSMKDNIERFYEYVEWLKEVIDQLETPPPG